MQIQVTWSPLVTVEDIGNSAIISYGLQWDAGVTSGPWINLVGYSSNSLLTTFTVTQSVTPGTVYTFRVQAKNVYGWGPFASSQISSTTVPAQMVPATTSYDSDGLNVKITWIEPYTHTSMPITAYDIIIKDNSGVYISHSSCDGADPTIISQKYCIVSMNSLRTAPFSLSTLGTLIQVRTKAKNDIGWGEYSNSNTLGVTIQTIPSVMSIPRRGSVTTTSQMNIEWDAVSDTGGTTILSYNLQFDDASNGANWFDV